jgi:hypothetical protein
MEELKDYIESVLMSIDGVNQFNLLIDLSELDEIQERKSGFVGLNFGEVLNNNKGNEEVTSTFIFENFLEQERTTYLHQMDVLKKIIGEFKGVVKNSEQYEFPLEWTLDPFVNRSVNATCGYFFQLKITILGGNNCKVSKI